MSDELTREQVEKTVAKLQSGSPFLHQGAYLLAHDAALRTRLAACEERVKAHKGLFGIEKGEAYYKEMIALLEAKLTAMEQERDAARSLVESLRIIAKSDTEAIIRLGTERDALQARVRVLEGELSASEFRRRAAWYEKNQAIADREKAEQQLATAREENRSMAIDCQSMMEDRDNALTERDSAREENAALKGELADTIRLLQQTRGEQAQK